MPTEKKISVKDIKAPDEFQTFIAKVAEFFKLYGGYLATAVVAVVVALVAGVLFSRHKDAQVVASAMAFQEKAKPLLQIKLDEQGNIKMDEEGVKKASVALDDFISKDTPLSSLALFAKGMALVATKDFANAVDVLRQALSKDLPFKFAVAEALGAALDNLGQKEEAEKAYFELTKSPSRLFRAVGYMHIGDLYNPLATVKEGEVVDREKARQNYEKGLDELKGDEALLSPQEVIQKRLLQHRLKTVLSQG
jgi:tetratricopeptide (TPR) repeat protein